MHRLVSTHIIRFILLALIAGCENMTLTKKDVDTSSLRFELEGIANFIPTTLLNNYPVKGKCVDVTTVTINLDGEVKSTPCLSGKFEENFDLSGKADGPLSLSAQGKTQTIKTELYKDTEAPSAPLTISGLGPTLSNSLLPRYVTINSSDDDYIYKTELISTGNCSAVNFGSITASALVFFPISLNANSNNTLCILSADRSGNWRATPVSSDTIYVDINNPDLDFSVTSLSAATNSSVTINWTLTEVNPDTSEPIRLEYSATGNAPWSEIDSQLPGSGPLSNEAYSFTWTTPGTSTGSGKLRLIYTDLVGNTGSSEIPVILDNDNPVINSMIIANGNPLVGVPSVRIQLDTTPAYSPITHVRISENSSFAGATWLPFNNGDRSFTLSLSPGDKDIYAQVRSAAGLTSNIVNGSVTLDFGSPPEIIITSPTKDTTFSPDDTVTIGWECTTESEVGLAPNPITRISYSVDDGKTFHVIQTNLPNNDSATTGHIEWTVPAMTPTGQVITDKTPMRILANCSSAAGVISSGISDFLNSHWQVLAGEPGSLDEGIHIRLANLNNLSGFFGDSQNAIYYPNKHAIMRMNPETGLVSQWLGSMETSGCTLASDGSGLIGMPTMIDISANDEILFYSVHCSRLYKVRISDKHVLWSRPVTVDVQPGSEEVKLFYLKSGYLYYTLNFATYELDLNNLASTPKLIIGQSTCSETDMPTVDTDAALAQLPCPSTAYSSYHSIASFDRKKIWTISNRGMDYSVLAEWDDVQQKYLVKPLGITGGSLSRCVHTNFDNTRLYCYGNYPGGTGRDAVHFDPVTGVRSPSHQLSNYKNFMTQIFVGAGKNSLFYYSKTNELFEVTFDVDNNSWSSNIIGGTPFHVYGNGDNVKKVAFTGVRDFIYNPLASDQSLYVRGDQHIRRIKFDISSTPVVSSIETAINANYIRNSTAQYGMAIARDGLSLVNTGTTNGVFTYHSVLLGAGWNGAANTVSNGINYVTFHTAQSDGWPLLTETFNNNSTGFKIRKDTNQLATMGDDGKLYFVSSRDSEGLQDLWIFETNGTAIKAVAGAEGASGYEATDDGANALGARLSIIHGIQTNADGDLLIIDGKFLRKITIATDASEPKIHDLKDYSDADAGFINFPGDKNWDHVIYDEASGWTYFAIAENTSVGQESEIWAAREDQGFVRINTDGIVLNSIYKKSLKLELTPVGLTVLDANKRRIIYTEKMP